MIGEFAYYEAVQFPSTTRDACLKATTKTPMGYGSSQMLHWFNQVRPVFIRAVLGPSRHALFKAKSVVFKNQTSCLDHACMHESQGHTFKSTLLAKPWSTNAESGHS
jgi:hypothetical protein